MQSYRYLVVATSIDRPHLALFAGLRDAGVAVRLLFDPASPRREAIRREFPDAGFLPVRNRLDWKAARALRRILVADPPDLLYAPDNRPLSISLMATRGLPVKVIAYRGTIGHVSRWDPASWLTYLHPRLAQIVCVSDAVQRHLRDDVRIPPERLVRIYKGHDPAWYDGPPERVATRAELGLPAEAQVVGFVGRMRPVKGVDVLIRALDELPPTTHLLLVGEVADPALKRLAAETPDRRARIHFAGPSTNVLGLLDLCDVFAMPSVSREGLPRAAIEAMCRRRPVVASAVGGLPELLDRGNCGLVVPPRDPAALAEAVGRLLADAGLRRQLGEAGRCQIVTRFHIRETIARTLALHQSLLKGRGSMASRMPSENAASCRRIVFVNFTADWGGGELQHLELAREFKRQGYAVAVCARPGSALIQKARALGLETLALQVGKWSFLSPTILRRLKTLLREARPAAVVFNGSLELKHLVLCGAHRDFAMVYRRGYHKIVKPTVLNRFYFRRITHLVAISDFVRRNALGAILERGFGPATVIHNGLLPGENGPLPAYDAQQIVAVGRLVEYKRFDLLIAAMPAVRQRVPGARLWIVGDGPQKEDLENRIRSLGLEGAVRILGFRNNVAEILSRASLFVHSAREEAFGVVFLEAMRQRLPCVAFRGHAADEIIEHGRTGLLVDEFSAPALADAIAGLLGSAKTLERMGQAGHARFLSRFTIEKSAEKFRRLLEG